MGQNKVIIILLLVVLVIGGIFGYKILNSQNSNMGITGKTSVSTSEFNNKAVSTQNSVISKNDLSQFISGISNTLENKTYVYDSETTKGNVISTFEKSTTDIDVFLNVFKIVIFIIVFGLYFFYSFGLMRLIEEEEYPSWLAWIPIVQTLLLIQVAYQNKTTTWIAVIFLILSYFINGIFAWIVGIMYLFALYKIYVRKSHHPTLFLILSIISGSLFVPIILFAIRNN